MDDLPGAAHIDQERLPARPAPRVPGLPAFDPAPAGRTEYYARLHRIRLRSQADARRAINLCLIGGWIGMVACASVLLFVAMGTVSSVRFQSSYHLARSVSMGSFLVPALFDLLCYSLLLIYCILCIVSIEKIYAYYYRLAWQQLKHENLAWLFTCEDFHQLITSSLAQRRFYGSAKFIYKRLDQYLSFCACYINTLRDAALKRERVDYWLLMSETKAIQSENIFNKPTYFYIVASFVALLLFGIGLPIFALMIVLLAPRYVISRAYLIAFLDFYLEEPRIDVDKLPPPAVPRGWWARQRAPWKRLPEGRFDP